MLYVIQSRRNPLNRDLDPKYYLIARIIGTVGIEQISEEIALATSLTRGDVDNVIKSFLDTIPKYLKMGFSVNLGELCNVHLTLQSEGSDGPEEVTPAKVKRIRPVFTPSPKLRRSLLDTPIHPYPDL